MVKRVELPNGEVAEFPMDMDDSAIASVISKEFPAPKVRNTAENSVMRDQSSVKSKSPVRPEYVDEVNRAFDQATPQQRKAMARDNTSVSGRIAAQRGTKYSEMDSLAKPSTTDDVINRTFNKPVNGIQMPAMVGTTNLADGRKEAPKAIAKPKEIFRTRTGGEVAKDVALDLGVGVTNLVGALPNAFAPEGDFAQSTRDMADDLMGKQSAPIRAKLERVNDRIQSAGQAGGIDGMANQFGQALSEYGDDPALAMSLIVQNLPSFIPGLAMGKLVQLAPKVLPKLKALASGGAALTAAAITNAFMNAGGARGEAYEDLLETQMDKNIPKSIAQDNAVSGSRLPGAVGFATGLVSGGSGLEGAVFGKATSAPIRKALSEFASEQAEEVLPKITTNLEASQYDDRSALQDVGRTMAETTIASLPTTAGTAALDAFRKTPEQQLANALFGQDLEKLTPEMIRAREVLDARAARRMSIAPIDSPNIEQQQSTPEAQEQSPEPELTPDVAQASQTQPAPAGQAPEGALRVTFLNGDTFTGKAIETFEDNGQQFTEFLTDEGEVFTIADDEATIEPVSQDVQPIESDEVAEGAQPTQTAPKSEENPTIDQPIAQEAPVSDSPDLSQLSDDDLAMMVKNAQDPKVREKLAAERRKRRERAQAEAAVASDQPKDKKYFDALTVTAMSDEELEQAKQFYPEGSKRLQSIAKQQKKRAGKPVDEPGGEKPLTKAEQIQATGLSSKQEETISRGERARRREAEEAEQLKVIDEVVANSPALKTLGVTESASALAKRIKGMDGREAEQAGKMLLSFVKGAEESQQSGRKTDPNFFDGYFAKKISALLDTADSGKGVKQYTPVDVEGWKKQSPDLAMEGFADALPDGLVGEGVRVFNDANQRLADLGYDPSDESIEILKQKRFSLPQEVQDLIDKRNVMTWLATVAKRRVKHQREGKESTAKVLKRTERQLLSDYGIDASKFPGVDSRVSLQPGRKKTTFKKGGEDTRQKQPESGSVLEELESMLTKAKEEYESQGMVKNARTGDKIRDIENQIEQIKRPEILKAVGGVAKFSRAIGRELDFRNATESTESIAKRSLKARGVVEPSLSDMVAKVVAAVDGPSEKPASKKLVNATAPEHVRAEGEPETGLTIEEMKQLAKEMREKVDEGQDAGVTRIFDAPAKGEVVRLENKVRVHVADKGWMTPAEAREEIAKWKANAKGQDKSANSDKVVLSLFDLSGEWSKPWVEAGYQVYRFDIQDDPEVGDVNNFSTEFFGDWFGDFDGNNVYAILAACPCTDFASSGAKHFKAKDEDGRTVSSIRLVKQTLAAIEYFKPPVWALENPVGRIESLTGMPPWRLSFNPNHLGDPYTKKTLIWGRFNGELPIAPVEPTEGSKMHKKYGGKSMATKNARSVTPEGFAYGFFQANNAIDNPVMAIANKFDRLDRDLFKRALDAGVTEREIENAIEDFYYQDLDDDAAAKAIEDLIAQTRPVSDGLLEQIERLEANAKPVTGEETMRQAKELNALNEKLYAENPKARDWFSKRPNEKLLQEPRRGEVTRIGGKKIGVTYAVFSSGKTVRVRIISDDGKFIDDAGYEHPDNITPTREQKAIQAATYNIGPPTVEKSKPAATEVSADGEPDFDGMFDELMAEEFGAKKAPAVPNAASSTKPAGPKKETRAQKLKKVNERLFEVLGARVGDTVTFTQAVDYVAANKPVKVDSVETNGDVWFSSSNGRTSVNVSFIQAQLRRGVEVQVQPGERKATDAAKSAAKNTAKGFDAAIDGLGKLFGGKPGQLNSGVGFDKETYEQAKPLFIQAAKNFKDAAADIREVMRAVMKAMAEKFGPGAVESAKPYVVQFTKDVYSGTIDLKEGNDNEQSAVSGSGAQAPGGVSSQEGEGFEGAGTIRIDSSGDGSQGDGREGSADESGLSTGSSNGSGVEGSDLFGSRADGRPAGPRSGSKGKRVSKRKGQGDSGREGDAGGLFQQPEVAPSNIPVANYTITDEVDLGKGTESIKFADNLLAIKTIKQIEAEKRRATPDEQRILARYVGWGGMANAFRSRSGSFSEKWLPRIEQLEGLLSKKELDQARASTPNAHYTAKGVVDSMWSLVQSMGFKGGLVLEPSIGTGNFVGLMPEALRGNTSVIGAELDSITARIAGQLYPQATVLHSDFGKLPLPNNSFDLVIGNPPFGDVKMRMGYKPQFNRFSIHNQFFLGTMDALKPKGVQVMVVSRFLMDAQDDGARMELARRGRLLGAIRLPDNAFQENAKTEVVTDILIFQKHSSEDAVFWNDLVNKATAMATSKKAQEESNAAKAQLPAWVNTTTMPDPLGGPDMKVNSYFAANKDRIMGRMERSGTMYKRNENDPLGENVKLQPGQDFEAMMRVAMGQLASSLSNTFDQTADVLEASNTRFKSMSESLRVAARGGEIGSIAVGPDGKLVMVGERETPEGEFELYEEQVSPETVWSRNFMLDRNGKWFRVVDELDASGRPVKVMKGDKATKRNAKTREVFESTAQIPAQSKLGEDGFARLTKMVSLRDLLLKQFELELTDSPTKQIESNRAELRKQWEAFVKAHGYLNSPRNSKVISEMPDEGLIVSLEQGYVPEITAAKAKQTGLKAAKDSAKPADILSKRAKFPYSPPTKAKDPAEALLISLSEFGQINPDRMASLLGMSVEQVSEALTSGDKPLAFYDPELSRLVVRDDYLSGEVVRKLRAAKQAGMQQNVAALEKVQPERWGSEQITAFMGSTWIPGEVYADFMRSQLGIAGAAVKFTRATNSFDVTGSSPENSEFNISRLSVLGLVSRLLNSQPMRITWKDSEGKTHVDQEATAQAGVFASQIKMRFDEWLMDDTDRRAKLTELFNEKFNVRTNRQWDGSHLELVGKVPDEIIKLRTHQKNAIWRGISQRFMLIDHAVGAGKTFTAIARAMERKRMGLSQKPMIVVPNHLVEQFAQDVYKLYPGAKVLAASKKDFEASRRRRLFAKIATGDFDIVIMAHSSFGFIQISPEAEQRFINTELDSALAVLKEAEEEQDQKQGGRPFKSLAVKKAENIVKRLTNRMEKLAEKGKDRLLTFEQMGVDDLTVDEAHEFKNLAYSTNLTEVRGMGDQGGSQKAWDLFSKVRLMQESPTGSVVFMTGTPISNSAVEMYNLMRYLASDQMADLGLENFDAWRNQFVEATSKFEPTESGGLKEVARLGRSWSNMRSLMDLYYAFTDAVSLDDIKRTFAEENPGKEFPVPKVKGGGRVGIKVPATKDQSKVLKEVIDGFNGLANIADPKKRNIERLKLMDRARKVSLDARMADKSITADQKGGKLDVAAENIKRLYDQWDDVKGTQVVFLDRGVKAAKGDDKLVKEYDEIVAKRDQALRDGDEQAYMKANEALDTFNADEVAELREALKGGWNAYDQLKKYLVERGIPEDEVRFVQEANNDEQKQALFDATKTGKIRVLIGSTPKMGAGTNVQDRLVALHHIDVTWKPSDIEQREGRIVRQGNLFVMPMIQGKANPLYNPDFEVEILAYVTERTVDAKLWDLNATKLKMINGIRSYTGEFNMEFEDSDSVSMDEIAAMASGDPLMLERVTLQTEIDRMTLLKRAFTRKQRSAQDSLDGYQKTIETLPGKIAKREEMRDLVAPEFDAAEKEFNARKVTIEGQTYTSRFDADKAADALIEQRKGEGENSKFLLTIDGEEFSNKAKVQDYIKQQFGESVPFALTVGGTEYRTFAGSVRAIIETGLSGKLTTYGTMYGGQLKGELFTNEGSLGDAYEFHLSLFYGNQEVASGYAGFGKAGTASDNERKSAVSNALKEVVSVVQSVAEYDRSRDEAQISNAKRESVVLKEQAGKPWPMADELKAKQDRLVQIQTLLSSAVRAGTGQSNRGGNRLKRADGSFVRQNPAVLYNITGNLNELGRIRKLFNNGKLTQASVPKLLGRLMENRKVKVLGELSSSAKETAAAMQWLLQRNPNLDKGLVSILFDGTLGKNTGGFYDSEAREVVLNANALSVTSGVHEVLHHVERMLPPDVQAKIRELWMRDWNVAFQDGDRDTREFMLDMAAAALGDQNAYNRAFKQLTESDRFQAEDWYHLFSPSEYWAVKGADYMLDRATEGWVQKAVRWMREFVAMLQNKLGMNDDYYLVKALNDVLKNVDGEFKSPGMLKDGQTPVPGLLRNIGKPSLDIASATVSREATTFDEARKQAKAFQGRTLTNKATGIVSVVSRNSLDKMLSGKAVSKSESPRDHSMAVANIDLLFERALLGWSKPDVNGDPNIKAIHRFFTPMVHNGKAQLVKMTVKETAQAEKVNPLYTIEAVEFVGAPPAAQWVGEIASADGVDPRTIRSARDVQSLAQAVQDFNAGNNRVLSVQGRQAQVDSPEFKKWFGESKVVDSRGAPQIVYHGTTNEFREFSDEWIGEGHGGSDWGDGFYFASNSDAANSYANAEGGNVMPVYLSIKNPATKKVMMSRRVVSALDDGYFQSPRDVLVEMGYDGIVIDHGKGGKEYIAFSPEQIKSAIGNNGKFNPKNPDILLSIEGKKAVEDMAEQATGKIIDRQQKLAVDLNVFERFVVHPRTIASFNAEFVPVYRAAVEQFETRDQINAELTRSMTDYTALNDKQKDNVNKALEQGRLAGQTFRSAENARLTDEEYKGYRAVRMTMDAALDKFKAQFIREQGYDPDKIKSEKDIVGLINDAMPDAVKEGIRRSASVIREIDQAKRRGYVPFTRYGQIGVYVKDSEGNTLHFEKVEIDGLKDKLRRFVGKDKVIENIAPVRDLMKKLAKQYPDARVGAFEVGKQSKEEVNMADLDRLANVADIDSNVWSEVSVALQRAVKAKGFRKHFFGSDNVPGYSKDFERGLADYIVGVSGYLARRQYQQKFDDAIAAIPTTMPKMKAYADKYREYINTPVEEAQAIRQMAFLYYIAGNLSTAIVNLSQQLFSKAYLSQFSTKGQGNFHFARANKDALKMFDPSLELFDPSKAPDDVARHVRRAWDSGLFVPLQTYENLGTAHNRSKMLRGVNEKVRKGVEIAALSFTAAERLNRIATFIATVRMAKSAEFQKKAKNVLRNNPLARADLVGEDFAYKMAELVIDETHYRMGKVNRPTFMRGIIGAPVTQFKSFMFQTLELMVRTAALNGPEGKKATLYILAIFMMLGGMFGVPFAESLVDLAEMAYKKATGEQIDLKAEARLGLASKIGPRAAEVLTSGAGPLVGVDLQAKAGMGDVVPMSVSDVLGIPAALTVGRIGDAMMFASQERYGAMAGALLPNFAANLLQSYEWSEEGVRKKTTGQMVIKADELDALQIAAKAIGFTPSEVTAIRNAEYAITRENNRLKDKAGKYHGRLGIVYAQMQLAQTREEAKALSDQAQAIIQEVAEYNEGKEISDQIILSRQSVMQAIEREMLGRFANDKRIRKASRAKAGELREAFTGQYAEEEE